MVTSTGDFMPQFVFITQRQTQPRVLHRMPGEGSVDLYQEVDCWKTLHLTT